MEQDRQGGRLASVVKKSKVQTSNETEKPLVYVAVAQPEYQSRDRRCIFNRESEDAFQHIVVQEKSEKKLFNDRHEQERLKYIKPDRQSLK